LSRKVTRPIRSPAGYDHVVTTAAPTLIEELAGVVRCEEALFGCRSETAQALWVVVTLIAMGGYLVSQGFVRSPRVLRGLNAAAGALLGGLMGFAIGAHFPRGGDPHYRAIIGWFESAILGASLGGLLFAALGAALRPAKDLRRRLLFATTLVLTAAVLSVTGDMRYFYWLMPWRAVLTTLRTLLFPSH
jgi:hypothetical protein